MPMDPEVQYQSLKRFDEAVTRLAAVESWHDLFRADAVLMPAIAMRLADAERRIDQLECFIKNNWPPEAKNAQCT